MRQAVAALNLMVVVLISVPPSVHAQSSKAGSSVSIPRLINISGVFRPADGRPLLPVETVTLSIYAEPEGGAPVWQETQSVALDERGRYVLLLGASSADGIPPDVFGSGEAKWLATRFERTGEVEGARVRLTSVPYALRASDAETLGGRPASDYVVAPAGGASSKAVTAAASPQTGAAAQDLVMPGTTNLLAKYVDSANVGDSAVYESGGSVGIGTTTPFDSLHVRFTNPTGSATGFAVQNLGNTATSYSGMLFYDQNGALGQFQGFNNSTHEYRINNIARNGGGQFNGSINFMTGSTSRFIVAPSGNIGIGTTAPSALLEVSNAVPGGPANMWMTSYTNAVNPYYMARRARGTPGAPTAVQNGDGLAGFYGEGYGTTAFGPGFAGGVTVQALQNWTDTAHGTGLTFTTTPIGSVAPLTRMTLDATGNLGIGTTTLPAGGILEVSNAGHTAPFGNILGSSFTGATPSGTLFVGRKARGTSAAPTSVLNGDTLVGFLGRGYGATSFGGTVGGMFVRAAENWTDTAQGSSLNFNTTPTGTITPGTRVTITSSGNVGIGTANPSAGLELSRVADDAVVATTTYRDGINDSGPIFLGRTAHGIPAAPTATQQGDILGAFAGMGFGATAFSNDVQFGVAGFAAENFTDTAHGAALVFGTTPLGSNALNIAMGLLPSGFLGIGTPLDVNGLPTAADRLQVFGDIRVGTSGTTGCLKNFAGTGLLGTCSSDRRLKKDITPFGPTLDKVTALQPVHYFWRAGEFPSQHFGDSQNYGLIAQDVEQVLPEIVVTNDDGFKAVDYSKLPLLTIQAVKELKAENDALKQRLTELDALKSRVAELERLMTEVVTASAQR